MFHGLALNLLFLSDRSFIILLVGSEAVAEYSFAATIALIPFAVSSSIEAMWIPYFNEKYISRNYTWVRNNFHMFLAFGSLLYIGIGFLSGWVVEYLSGTADYSKSLEYVGLMLFCNYLIMCYSFFVNLLNFQRTN